MSDARGDSMMRCYFFQIPNILDDDSRLTVHAFRLYCHIKRVAGEDGECYQSIKTLCKVCHMTKPTLLKSRRLLEEAGYIDIDPRRGQTSIIRVRDIWSQNIGHFLAKSIDRMEDGEAWSTKQPGDGIHFDQEVVKNDTTKNNPIRITHEEEGRNLVSSSSPLGNEQIKELFAALKERRGYNYPNHSAEAKAIRWMLREGYTPDDILGCYDKLKRKPFWEEKTLAMMSVQKEIGEWKVNKDKPVVWRVR
jgi:hypothetical protein